MRNQSDFYSFFGAVDVLRTAGSMPTAPEAIQRLSEFLEVVDDEDSRISHMRMVAPRAVGILWPS